LTRPGKAALLARMSLASSTTNIRQRVGDESDLGGKLQFDFGDDGCIHIDATVVPNAVTNTSAAADCTIRVSLEDFEAMLSGALEPTTAFMSGKLMVDGDMAMAMKLQVLL
jgi:putative sterol carrier protein